MGDGHPRTHLVLAGAQPLGAGGPPTVRRQLRRHCVLRSLQHLQLVAAGAKAALLGPHPERDLTAIAEPSCVGALLGRDLLELEKQLFHQWHRWRDGKIDRQELQSLTAPIRQAFESKLQEASDLSFHKGEKTPWATRDAPAGRSSTWRQPYGPLWMIRMWSRRTVQRNGRSDQR